MFCVHAGCHQPLVSGGLFDDESKDSELAFRFGVQAINNQRNRQTDGLLEAGKETFIERLQQSRS